MRYRTSLTIILLTVLIAGVVQLAPQPSAAAGTTGIPAPMPGGPRPTISVSPTHGYAGQRVTVTGRAVNPYPGVRVAWVREDATLTTAIAPRTASNTYQSSIVVPSDVSPGTTKICAAVTGSAAAAFVCAPFTVGPPPPGRVRVQLPAGLAIAVRPSSPAATNAAVKLYDRAGNAVASVPVQGNSVTFPSVPPGDYTAAVAGVVPVLVESSPVQVTAGQQVVVNLQPITACIGATVVAVRASPSGKPTGAWDFGTYISSWPLSVAPTVTFTADLQVASGANLTGVGFILNYPDGRRGAFGQGSTPIGGTTYQVKYNVAGERAGLYPLDVEPKVVYFKDGKSCSQARAAHKKINIIEQPLRNNPAYKFAATDMKWNGQHYVFGVAFCTPTIAFPDPAPKLPFVGRLESRVQPCVRMQGTMDLDGNVRAQLFRFDPRAKLFNVPVGKAIPLMPEGGEGTLLLGSPASTAGSLRQLSYDFPRQSLFSFDKEMQLFSSPLWSFAGIVTVRLNVKAGISGDLTFYGTIRPLAPAVNVGLEANLRPRVTVEILADILMGIVEVGGSGTAEAELSVRFRGSTDDPRVVWVEDPCMRVRLTFTAFLRVSLLDIDEEFPPQTVLDEVIGGCGASAAAAAAPAVTPSPVLPAPALASGPGGRMLAVYVRNSGDATTPRPQVVARFRATDTGVWGAELPLTDGAHMVQNPVAAFVGPKGDAVVAWTENTMSAAEARAAGANLPAHLRRQEIVVANWNGAKWSAPKRLTADLRADGMSAIAGDATGATLAWVTDADGTPATAGDWRIKVTNVNVGGTAWTPVATLNAGGATNVLNAQVSVARRQGKPLLAWVTDHDTNRATNGDRRIVVAEPSGSTWKITPPSTLPVGAESPSVALDVNGQPYLAFLVRGKDPDGVTDTGIGTQGAVWSARRVGSGWQARQLRDEQGQPVYGERPRVSTGPTGEPLLLFRRFGAAGTNAELGQIALSQLAGDGTPRPPLYLTDDARQHWQPAVAINQASGEAIALHVGRAAVDGTSSSADQAPRSTSGSAQPALAAATLSGGDSPVESTVIAASADPALDPALALSQQHATPGSTVVVTATVRNLGRAPATNLKVTFYHGTGAAATVIGSVPLTGTLAFNQSRAVPFPVKVANGEQPISAKISSSGGGNTSAANDLATAKLGALPPPTLVRVARSAVYPGALEINWQPVAATGVAGYRVLRATRSGGPYEVVGEAARSVFQDLLLASGPTYYYVVQAYDAGGVLSPLSMEASNRLAGHGVYLPLVLR